MMGWTRPEGRSYVKERCVEEIVGVAGMMATMEQDEASLMEYQVLKEHAEVIVKMVSPFVPRGEGAGSMVRILVERFQATQEKVAHLESSARSSLGREMKSSS